MISIHVSCTAENFKAMLQCVRDLELAKYNILQPFEETRQKLQKLSCFDFSPGFDVKLQGGPLDHNPRKIPVEDSLIIILQNNSK